MVLEVHTQQGYIRIGTGLRQMDGYMGDGRTFILGTEGYIEMRKIHDIAGRKSGNRLFLVNQQETKYYNCSNILYAYGEQLVNDVVPAQKPPCLQGPTASLPQSLALTAQQRAHKIMWGS